MEPAEIGIHWMRICRFQLALSHLHPSDVEFMCKIRQMQMRISRVIKISASCYSYCDST